MAGRGESTKIRRPFIADEGTPVAAKRVYNFITGKIMNPDEMKGWVTLPDGSELTTGARVYIKADNTVAACGNTSANIERSIGYVNDGEDDWKPNTLTNREVTIVLDGPTRRVVCSQSVIAGGRVYSSGISDRGMEKVTQTAVPDDTGPVKYAINGGAANDVIEIVEIGGR